VNNTTNASRWNYTKTQFQVSDTETCQYGFVSTTGRNSWFVGNPSNPGEDTEQFSITAVDSLGSASQILRLQSYGHTSGSNPATAIYRTMALAGFINLSAADNLGWVNFQNIAPPPAPVGGVRLYAISDALTVDGVPLATTLDLPHDLTAGEATMNRRETTTNAMSPSNGALQLTFFTARRSEDVTQIQATVNVGAVDATLARVGVYTADGSDNLTLVASTAEDPTLFGSTGLISKSLSATLSRYAVHGMRWASSLTELQRLRSWSAPHRPELICLRSVRGSRLLSQANPIFPQLSQRVLLGTPTSSITSP